MLKKKLKKLKSKITIDLDGSQGNAFYLIGIAKNLAKHLGYDKHEFTKLQSDMMSSDYDNLVYILESHFGEFIELETSTPEQFTKIAKSEYLKSIEK